MEWVQGGVVAGELGRVVAVKMGVDLDRPIN